MTNNSIDLPSIAQLVERRTVEVKMISLGRWFKSGSKETFFFLIRCFFIVLFSCCLVISILSSENFFNAEHSVFVIS